MKRKKKRLENNYDFIAVPSIVWHLLIKLYTGGPLIPYSEIKAYNSTFEIFEGGNILPVVKIYIYSITIYIFFF